MAKIGAAILVLAGTLAARGAAREIAAPFEGLDRLAQARISPAPSAEPEPESGAIASLPGDVTLTSDHPKAIQVIHFRDEEGRISTFTLQLGHLSADLAIEANVFSDVGALNEFFPTEKTAWDRWREQAIADLPEHLRNDSDYRKAIDHQYHLLSGSFVNTEHDWLPNRPPVGGYDIGGVGFTDIDDRAEIVHDLRAQPDPWTAFCQDWRARAIAALPEAERNDPNRLKEIDTTLEQIVSQARGGPSWEELQWNRIAYEVMVSRQKPQVAAK